MLSNICTTKEIMMFDQFLSKEVLLMVISFKIC